MAAIRWPSIAGINRAIGAYGDSMRDYKVESKFPPSFKEVSSLVEDHDWGVGAPVEYVNVVLPVHGYIGNLREGPLPGALEEAVRYLVPIVATAEGCHLASSPFPS